jgi:archaellum component FlaC
MDVRQGILVNLFSQIEHSFRRLEIYTEVPSTTAMREITVEILAEVLAIIGIATKEVERERMSELILNRFADIDRSYLEKFLKKLIGNTDIEDSLRRLDKLTQEEAKMASAELLKITHSIEGKVVGVDERIQDVGDDVRSVGEKIQGIDKTVQGADDKVQGVDDKVQGVDGKVQGVDDKVQGVDGKLDDINRSSSHLFPAFPPEGLS